MAGSTQQLLDQECQDHFQDGGGMHRPSELEVSLSPLLKAIESEVIPRLMLAHSRPGRAGPNARTVEYEVTAQEVEHFAVVILGGDFEAALSEVAGIRARGAALETIYLGLLAGTARHLGVLWHEDLCDFTQVTAGLWQLQRVLNQLSGTTHHEPVAGGDHRIILLSGTPGEQHSFGLKIVAEFFRRAQWQVTNEIAASSDEIVGSVRHNWFAVVGLSLAAERHVGTLSALVTRIRRHSSNRTVGILVGGPAFLNNADLFAKVGADAMASDGAHAVAQAHALLALIATGE